MIEYWRVSAELFSVMLKTFTLHRLLTKVIKCQHSEGKLVRYRIKHCKGGWQDA